MSLRVPTLCLLLTGLLLVVAHAGAKPPDLPNYPKITFTPPANSDGSEEQSPPSDLPEGGEPQTPVKESDARPVFIRCVLIGINPFLGLVPVDATPCKAKHPTRRPDCPQQTGCLVIEGAKGDLVITTEPAVELCPLAGDAPTSCGTGDTKLKPEPKPETITCPYLKEKANCPAKTDAVETSSTPLDNLAKLEKAEELYRKAMYCEKTGHYATAEKCYEEIQKLCPGSRYDVMASKELKKLAKLKKTKPATDAATEEQEPPQAEPKMPPVSEKLQQKMEVHFRETPLRQTIDDLRHMSGLNIVLDRPALEESAVSLETPVTLELSQVPVQTAIKMTLLQAGLAFKVEDEVVVITTLVKARGKLVAKTYAIGDLIEQEKTKPAKMTARKLQPVVTAEQIVKLITKCIEPATWSEHGGSGTIDYFPLGEALVISQTADVQEQVEGLLSEMRRCKKEGKLGEFFSKVKDSPRIEIEITTDGNQPDRLKKKSKVGSQKSVGQLLESCRQAMMEGRLADAERMLQEAMALDPQAVESHPLVYKLGLQEQLKEKTDIANRETPFITPSLPGFDVTVIAVLQKLLAEQTEKSGLKVEVDEMSGEETAEPPMDEPQEQTLYVPKPETDLTVETAQSEAFIKAINVLKGEMIERLTSGVCAEVDGTAGKMRGRCQFTVGSVSFRAAWNDDGHGSFTFGVPVPLPVPEPVIAMFRMFGAFEVETGN